MYITKKKHNEIVGELKAQIASLSAKIQEKQDIVKDEVIVEPIVEQETLEEEKAPKAKSNKKA